MKGWAQQHVDDYYRRTGLRADTNARKAASPPAPSKYRSTPTAVDGARFDSKLEARFYQQLKLERIAGTVLMFTRQMRFDLPGGVIYRLDFFVVRPDTRRPYVNDEIPTINEYIDCKGLLLQESKNKIKQVEAIYGIKIKLIRRGDI